MADLLRQAPIEYEILRNNRFELIFPSDIGLESWMVQTGSKPKLNVNSVELPYMNLKYYVPGQVNWEPMDFEINQYIGPSSSQKLMEWIRLMIESLSGRMGYGKGYMKNLTLRSLDPTGVAVEEWILVNCFITNADFGALDHGDDGVQKVKFTIQPQVCIQSY